MASPVLGGSRVVIQTWCLWWEYYCILKENSDSVESDTTQRLHFHFSLSCTGEGNGSPLQCSCLENPGDGVAQSRARLKWLSSSSKAPKKREKSNNNKNTIFYYWSETKSQRWGSNLNYGTKEKKYYRAGQSSYLLWLLQELPRWLRGKEPTGQCKRPWFHPCAGQIPWRRKWQTTPGFLPGEFHGQSSLANYIPWSHKESDTTERLYNNNNNNNKWLHDLFFFFWYVFYKPLKNHFYLLF